MPPTTEKHAARLVIVESPAKARTIARMLGDGYVVESSIGHIRDLPRNAAEVPAALKGEPWARLGVDVEHGFAPLYVVSRDKKAQVAKLRKLLSGASELFLATDEDREGEAIAWHLLDVLRPNVPVRRMVFHEITPPAIAEAVAHPRELDQRLVDAQETRRILDRLYGYEVSPVLWKKVMPKLSAGRVQSVATRIIVERERERMRFVAAAYHDLSGEFAAPADPQAFPATLVELDGRRVATGRDFGADGRLQGNDVVRLDAADAAGLLERLRNAAFQVASVQARPYRRSPYPPFMTSTLQQEAGRKLRLSSQRTMSLAQRLYENGYITYMRTDSTVLSASAVAAAREQARALYGPEYVPDAPRSYHRKVKNAQEAHEAIRPAGEVFRTPDSLAGELAGEELRLYELIWKRTVASQMSDARGESVSVRLRASSATGEATGWAASGKVIHFPGFLRAYVEGADDPEAELEDSQRRLPAMAVGDLLDVRSLAVEAHTTTPPPRFTEASLVKALEELGVGRPSTYASIISTIQDRGYVSHRGAALVPSFVAFAVVALLEEHFTRLVDYAFTASLEDDLDAIATGQADPTAWLTRFYFGATPAAADGELGLQRLVAERLGEIDAREVNSIPIGTDAEGREIVVRVGRYGPYLQRGTDRASVPEGVAPDELSVERAAEILAANSAAGERELGPDEHGDPVVVRLGRYGPYVASVPAPESGRAPRTASLLRSMTPENVTLPEALRLLALPRVVGVDPEDHLEITAANGRYGPYVRKGDVSRSLDSEEQLFTITLDEARELFTRPRGRPGGRTPAEPLRILGVDPNSGGTITVRKGRFGPYVTDGATNASLRTQDSPEDITAERAAELLADRRARGPVTKTRPARRTAAPARRR